MSQQFEQGLMNYLETSDDLSSESKKFKKWLEKRPKGLLRKRALRQMEDQADAIVSSNRSDFHEGYGDFQAIDWQKLLEMLGPLLKLILSLFV